MNGYLNIPGYGDSHWKAPVANAASLPITGSLPGDVRVTLDTFATYTWNGSAWLISSGGNAFGIIQTPYGTFPVADGHTDSLTFTSNDSSVVITGDATTDTVDFSVTIPASGIASINADTTSAQTLTVGTSGTDFAIVDNLAGDHKFNLPTASALNRGALSSADWTTFNNKQPAGSYITDLTGEVTASGPGSVAATVKTNLKVSSIGTTIDGAGSIITTGLKSFVTVPYDCTINSVTLLADISGSIVIDILKVAYSGFPGSVSDSITAAAKPTISAAQKSVDNTLTGWITSISAGDVLEFNVDSCSTITKVNLVLKVTKT